MARMTQLQRVAANFIARKLVSTQSETVSGGVRYDAETGRFYSYTTIIAIHLGDKIGLDKHKYSMTTTKHQSSVRRAASEAGIPIVDWNK